MAQNGKKLRLQNGKTLRQLVLLDLDLACRFRKALNERGPPIDVMGSAWRFLLHSLPSRVSCEFRGSEELRKRKAAQIP